MNVPLNDVSRLNERLRSSLQAAVSRVLSHGQYILGTEVIQFEEKWRAYLGCSDAIGCSNGTDALTLALLACGIGSGDEVITTPNTFFGTAEAILATGARPVFVDVELHTGLIDPKKIEAAITSRTRALLPVHLYGQPAEMGAILQIARKHGLRCIEDSAQAHGATYHGKKLGTLGDLGCFSFFPGKNLGGIGDAGAVVSSDPELFARARKIRDHGRNSKYEHGEFGRNMRMDGIQAAVLLEKLPFLDEWNQRRREVAAIYHRDLPGVADLALPPRCETSAYHLFVIRHPRRDWLSAELKRKGVETGVHYPIPCHLQPAWTSRFGNCDLPMAARFASECLSLPIHGLMTDEEASTVVSRIRELLT